MKKIKLFIISISLACLAKAQNVDYNVVFDMTSKDTTNQQSLIRQLTFIKQANANAKLEVVIYGQGLDLVMQNGRWQQAVSALAADKNVTFKVCAVTMKRLKVEPGQLVAGVQTVPDGIYEIITKQREGWGYIKVGH
jgi:intracellular sulfur oxidation DsrE/DsrF family protein